MHPKKGEGEKQLTHHTEDLLWDKGNFLKIIFKAACANGSCHNLDT